MQFYITYDHILLNTRDPVRSPIYKQQRAELVLGSVTTWESSVLYVLLLSFLLINLECTLTY